MRIVLFVIVVCVSLIVPLYWFLLIAALYSLRWFGVELLFLSCMLDVYFGTHMLPIYLLATAATMMIVEIIKPRFSFNVE